MKYCPRNVRGLLRGRFCACFGGDSAAMRGATPPSGPEVAAEQAALDHALASLGTMRQRAEKLLQDLIAAGNPDLDYVAALSRRVSLLADSPRPLLFGRIDEEEGPTWRIGRRHVEDTRSDPVVVDWRAPVAVPFYRASAKDHLGLARRRQIMVDRPPLGAVGGRPFRWRGGARSWWTATPSSPWPTTSSVERAAAAMPRPRACEAGMPCWPSSSAPAPERCSTSSPRSRPSKTRSSVPHST